MRRSLLTHRGFTLIEVLIVMAMIGVIMGAVYSLYITNLRTAYTSDETVEVQQNLRIAMDSVARDLRMAGMLVDYGNSVYPISITADNTGPNGSDGIGSDGITLNMASATGNYAKIASDITPAGTSAFFPIASATDPAQAGDGDVLQEDDLVRIIRPLQSTQPSGEATFKVKTVRRQIDYPVATTTPRVELENTSGTSMAGIEFKRGDMIAKVNGTDITTPSPNTVEYKVVTNALTPATLTTDPNCPVNQRCLARRINNEVTGIAGPVWQIIAQNIDNFQLRYLLDDNNVVDAPPDRSLIKGVMVVISGETVTTSALSGNVPKSRQLTSVVKLRNRR